MTSMDDQGELEPESDYIWPHCLLIRASKCGADHWCAEQDGVFFYALPY